MQIAKAGKNYLAAEIKIAFPGYWPHLLNQPGLGIDFYSAFKLAIMIGDPPLNAQHGKPFSRR
jgi:hypothetical protein